MPPKVKVTKEEIIAAALEILRQKGMEAVNARAVARGAGVFHPAHFQQLQQYGRPAARCPCRRLRRI